MDGFVLREQNRLNYLAPSGASMEFVGDIVKFEGNIVNIVLAASCNQTVAKNIAEHEQRYRHFPRAMAKTMGPLAVSSLETGAQFRGAIR